ncbi:MAG: hypothetical protein ACOYM7_03395 [Paludibacter sp.]
MKNILLMLALSTILFSCKSKQIFESKKTVAATQSAIIYKTTADFSQNVPVIMNSSRTEIVSYPAPTDIFYNGILAQPTLLKNDYLLDNRGITENVVFLKYTYNQYSQFKTAPSIAEMMQNILEKYPLMEFINCGTRTNQANETTYYNAIIDSNFEGCKKSTITVLKITAE